MKTKSRTIFYSLPTKFMPRTIGTKEEWLSLSPEFINLGTNGWGWEGSFSLLCLTHWSNFKCLTHSLGLGDLKVLVTNGEMLPLRNMIIFHLTGSPVIIQNQEAETEVTLLIKEIDSYYHRNWGWWYPNSLLNLEQFLATASFLAPIRQFLFYGVSVILFCPLCLFNFSFS